MTDLLGMAGLKPLLVQPIAVAPGAILGFVCVRDEALRIAHFLDYHRRLGVTRFFTVDNGSTDGTLEYLLAQPDTCVYAASGSYAESRCGVDWLNALLEAHGSGHWALTLDADELFVYPDCETLLLPDLVARLDQEGAEALPGFMLDMFAEGPIQSVNYRSGTSFLATCPFFRADGFHERAPDGLPVRGGTRHMLFWDGHAQTKPSPVLYKVPLVRWRSGLSYRASTHQIEGVVLSRASCVLLHFKLFSDFVTNAMREAARKEHWNGAAQYQVYNHVLSHRPDISAYEPGAIRYQGSRQLIELGLMRALEY